jgi:G3E family GTPase
MTDFYLITGFLGAGKTSLLKSLLPQFAGRNVRLIINEFGKVGLDGALLREQGARVKEIVNGSVFCVCRLDQFESALSEAMADTPDVIFVETSGLSDPGSIRTILADDERAGRLRYRGAICLVDAPRFRKLITTARSCKKQLAVADLVLINKCDMVNEAECVLVEQQLHSICLADSARTTYGTITREQLERLSPCDHAAAVDHRPDLTLQKESLLISPACTSQQVVQMLTLIAEDTYRIKGFLAVLDGNFLVDCVGTDVRITPYAGSLEHENRLTLLAGEGMPLRKSVRSMLQQYGELASQDRNE